MSCNCIQCLCEVLPSLLLFSLFLKASNRHSWRIPSKWQGAQACARPVCRWQGLFLSCLAGSLLSSSALIPPTIILSASSLDKGCLIPLTVKVSVNIYPGKRNRRCGPYNVTVCFGLRWRLWVLLYVAAGQVSPDVPCHALVLLGSFSRITLKRIISVLFIVLENDSIFTALKLYICWRELYETV